MIQPGDKFNRLTCVRLSHTSDKGHKYYLWQCECGNEKIIMAGSVKAGRSKSCGCLSMEIKRSRKGKKRGKARNMVTQVMGDYVLDSMRTIKIIEHRQRIQAELASLNDQQDVIAAEDELFKFAAM